MVVLADELEPDAAELRAGVDSRGLYIVNLIVAEAAWPLGTLCMGLPTSITLMTGMGTPDDHHALVASLLGVGDRPVRFVPAHEPAVSARWNLNVADSHIAK